MKISFHSAKLHTFLILIKFIYILTFLVKIILCVNNINKAETLTATCHFTLSGCLAMNSFQL